MGFNFSGIAISKNYENNIDSLAKAFNWNLVFEKEISFEEASQNWKDEGICDIYFAEQATLVFVNPEMVAEPTGIPGTNTLVFALIESAMAFNLNYFEDRESKRVIAEVDGDRVIDDGEKLAAEQDAGDTSEVIWNQLGTMLGKRFWDIELEEKAFRYLFK